MEWAAWLALDVRRHRGSILFLVANSLAPESPRWLAMKGKRARAFRVLERLGGSTFARQVLEELAKTNRMQTKSRSILAELSSPGIAKMLLLGVVLAVLQQWCGIDVIFNCALEAFAGGPPDFRHPLWRD